MMYTFSKFISLELKVRTRVYYFTNITYIIRTAKIVTDIGYFIDLIFEITYNEFTSTLMNKMFKMAKNLVEFGYINSNLIRKMINIESR